MIGYLVGAAAVIGGAMLLRKYLYSRPVSFSFEGARYTRHPDGSFTSAEGAPVLSPQLEKVKAHWEEMSSATSDSQSYDSDGGGDGGGD
jgi:hypothetical protein